MTTAIETRRVYKALHRPLTVCGVDRRREARGVAREARGDDFRAAEGRSFCRAGDQQVVRPPTSSRTRGFFVFGQRPPSSQR